MQNAATITRSPKLQLHNSCFVQSNRRNLELGTQSAFVVSTHWTHGNTSVGVWLCRFLCCITKCRTFYFTFFFASLLINFFDVVNLTLYLPPFKKFSTAYLCSQFTKMLSSLKSLWVKSQMSSRVLQFSGFKSSVKSSVGQVWSSVKFLGSQMLHSLNIKHHISQHTSASPFYSTREPWSYRVSKLFLLKWP